MAWLKVWYDVNRQDQVTATATVDNQGNVTATTTQFIQTLFAQSDGAAFPTTVSALSAADPGTGLAVPTTGDSETVDGMSGFIVTRVMPKRDPKNRNLFEIQVEYTAKNSVQPPDKAKWNINLSFKGQETTQQAFQDSTGANIVNTAGQPYDPSVTETINDEVVTISYDTTSPPDLSGMRGKVNSDEISFDISGIERDYTERQLLLKDGEITTTFALGDATPVWKVSLTFVYRSDTWIDQILDQGYYQLQTISGVQKLVQMMDFVAQQPLSAPAMLDASGHQLAVGGTPHYTTFKIQGETALSSLFTDLS